MPTYQYRCTACENDFEKVQKFSDAALTTCEECGGALRKVYSAVGVVFKGSGFYATDNRTSGAGSASIPAQSESSGSSSSASSEKPSGSSSSPASSSASSSGSATTAS